MSIKIYAVITVSIIIIGLIGFLGYQTLIGTKQLNQPIREADKEELPIDYENHQQGSAEDSMSQEKIDYQEHIYSDYIQVSSYEELSKILNNIILSSSIPGREGPIVAVPTISTLETSVHIGDNAAISKRSIATLEARYSRTNVQVEGIDEADIVKTDGRYIYLATGEKILIIKAYPATDMEITSVIDIGADIQDITPIPARILVNGLYISKSKTSVMLSVIFTYYSEELKVGVKIYNVTDRKDPVNIYSISVSGRYVSSRLYNNTIYLVAQKYIDDPLNLPKINDREIPVRKILIPRYPIIAPVYTLIVAIDLDKLTYSQLAILTGQSNKIYVSYRYMYIAYTPSHIDRIITVINNSLDKLPQDLVDILEPLINSKQYIRVYNALKSYLANVSQDEFIKIVSIIEAEASGETWDTAINVFKLDRTSIQFYDRFTIPGILLDQFAFAEYKDTFIVATTVREAVLKIIRQQPPRYVGPGTPGEVVIKHVEDGKVIEYRYEIPKNLTKQYIGGVRDLVYLNIYPGKILGNSIAIYDLVEKDLISILDDIAPGEQIKAARLVGSILYLVTFRDIDPLFAIDISDPKKPRVLGYIKVPGYSEYMHPLNDSYILGIGLALQESGVDRGLKISLFNISDPERMSEQSKIIIPYSWSPVFNDHRVILVDEDRRYIAFPVYSYKIPGLSYIAIIQYDLDEGKLLKPHIVWHPNARAIYIGDILYTISITKIILTDLNTFEIVGEFNIQTSISE